MSQAKIVSFGGDLYHLSCLSAELRPDGKTVPPAELEEDQVCEDCMEPLVGAETDEDEDDEEGAQAS